MIVLIVVTSLAGQRQIVENTSASQTFGDDVFDRKRLSGEAGLTPTVLTAVLSPFGNFIPLSPGDAITHGQEP